MTQSPYDTYTVNDRDRKAYEESWETKKPYLQSYFDRRSVTYQYQQPMSQYFGDNKIYFGQSSLTHNDNTGRKFLSYGYNGNNTSIANGGNLYVPRPRPAQPLAVPRSTSPKSRSSPPRFQPPSTRSQLPSAISGSPSPTCQPPSPTSRSLLPTSRPPTPRPRSRSLRCRSPLQQTQTMHDPSAFTCHQFQKQDGNRKETHNYHYQQFYYQDGGYWNHPEICYTDLYHLPPSRTSGVQLLIERERNEVNYSGHSQRQTLINGTKQMASEYSIHAQINERRQLSTSTYPEEHNQTSVEYFKQDEINKNEPPAQLMFLPIEEISRTKYENDKSNISPRTGSWQGQSESRHIIRNGQYRKAPYATKCIGTPTNIRLRSTTRTSETERNRHLPIYGSVSPLPSNVPMVQNHDTNVATNTSSGQRSQEQSLGRRGNIHISKSGIGTPLLGPPYLEDGPASTVYPAMSPDSDRRVVIQCSTLGGTVGADLRLKHYGVLPGYQIPQQWARPVKQSRHIADRTHATSWREHSDLINDMPFNFQEPNTKHTGWPPTSKGDQNFTNSAKETFAENATEQYNDFESDILKTAVTDEIPTEIGRPSAQSDPACTKAKEWRPKYLQTKEKLHLLKGTVAEENANNTTGVTDSPKAAESKDGPQNNPAIVALIDRLLKEARTACDHLQQQGQWQQENTTGRIRTEKSKGGRPNTSGLFDTCGSDSDIKDNRTPFSRSSRRLHPGIGREQKEFEVTKDIRLLMSDLKICGNIVTPAKEPASSGTWPLVKKDLDSDKEDEKSNTRTYNKEDAQRCAIKAERRLPSNSLSLTMNTSNGCVDRVIRIVSSVDLLSTLSEPKRSIKRWKGVLRQEEDEKDEKEDSLVNIARNARTVFSELSENTKRAGSSLSDDNIIRAKRSKPEGDVTRSALIQRKKNIEPEEKSKKRTIDENENDIKSSYPGQEHDGPVSSDVVLESHKIRTRKEVYEDDVPKSSCFSQEPVRSSLSKQESSNKSFISEDHDSTVNGTKIIESDNETRKLASKDTIPEHEKRKTNDDSEDNDNRVKRSKLVGDVRRPVLIQEEKNIKTEEKSKKRKVDENETDLKPSYSDQNHEKPASSKDEDLEFEKKRRRTGVDENDVSKSSCFSQELDRSLSEQEQKSSNKSFISEDNDITVNGTKQFESDGETRKLVLKTFIPEHEERETNDDKEDNEDLNSLPLRQEPDRPSSSRMGSGNNLGTLLLASVNNADISALTSTWTHEKESGPERVRKSKSMKKTRKRRTIVNELKPPKSDSLTELFKLLRI